MKIRFNFKLFLRNLCRMSVHDDRELYRRVDNLEAKVQQMEWESIIRQMMDYVAFHPEYKQETEYLSIHGRCLVPYERKSSAICAQASMDRMRGMPYILHSGKRLYFPKDWSLAKVSSSYKWYIDSECLLGGDYLEKQPHQYLTESFDVAEGEVLVDMGSAEALLVLDSIDKISKAYIVESDRKWLKALKATFRPFRNKVIVIDKYAGREDSGKMVKLSTLLEKEKGPVFIKMDIEGAELDVLEGSEDFLRERDNIKIACCTYHKNGDEESIKNLLEKCGYKTEFSEGVILCNLYDDLQPPYFRHGVIRACKKDCI